MTRQQLQQLSKPELIEIILQQQGMIRQQQALIEELQQTIAQLHSRVADLEEQSKRLMQPSKDCSNSSLPPSKSAKANRREAKRGKKRSPKHGHQGASPKRQPPDLIVECRPALDFSAPGEAAPGRRDLASLIPPRKLGEANEVRAYLAGNTECIHTGEALLPARRAGSPPKPQTHTWMGLFGGTGVEKKAGREFRVGSLDGILPGGQPCPEPRGRVAEPVALRFGFVA